MVKASEAPVTRRVTCGTCGKRTEIMVPSPDHDDTEIVWQCPAFTENGIDMCGAQNSTDV